MDLDGNGTIDYNEFITATINKTKVLSKQNLETTFKAFDKVMYLYKKGNEKPCRRVEVCVYFILRRV